jgi:hypothetical protein
MKLAILPPWKQYTTSELISITEKTVVCLTTGQDRLLQRKISTTLFQLQEFYCVEWCVIGHHKPGVGKDLKGSIFAYWNTSLELAYRDWRKSCGTFDRRNLREIPTGYFRIEVSNIISSLIFTVPNEMKEIKGCELSGSKSIWWQWS